jgi:hydrogenase-4 component F
MFFTAGNVRESFGTLRMRRIHGMARSMPWTSAGLVVGSLAIVGMPPFSLFISEFMILTAAFSASRYLIAILLLVSLSVVFGALLHHFQRMLAGKRVDVPAKLKLLPSDFAVMGVCTALLILFGVHIPSMFAFLLQRALVVLQ